MRKKSKQIKLGNLLIGGGSPISIQSMCTTDTSDFVATVAQIRALEQVGCQVARVAVPDVAAGDALAKILSRVSIPLVADIHFDYRLALQSIVAGVQGLRINPGNIGSDAKVQKVVEAAKDKGIPIRIGVNAGSLDKKWLNKYGVSARALVESALEHTAILERCGFQQIKISVKASSVPLMVESYRLLAQKVAYPLHLGVTEAGDDFAGLIKSSMGIGALLLDGIGDTIRVSLTADPVQEVLAAKEILKSLGLRKGLQIISCPTCGRTKIDLIGLATKVKKALLPYQDLDLKVAVMGCVVNGPQEAKEADYGVAGGVGEGLLFAKGQIVKKVAESELLSQLITLIEQREG